MFGAIKAVGVQATELPIRYFCTVIALIALYANPASGRGEELLQAARDGNSELAVTLIESGADVRQTGAQGETALHWAAFHGLRPLASVLIEQGASVNARVHNGNTPLHQAAYRGHLQVVELLVALGAAVSATNKSGLTATQWAHRNGYAAVLSFLLAHGGRLDSPLTPTVGTEPIASAVPERFARRPLHLKVLPRHTSAPGQSPTVGIRGLSTRLGDLPPLVLKMPGPSAADRPSLQLTREFEGRRSSSMAKQAPSRPPLPSQRAVRNAAWIQLGSFRTAAHAQTGWRNTTRKHQDLLSAFEPTVVTARIDNKGTFHRLRIGPLPATDARRLCAALEAGETTCLVVLESGR